jgi:tetratricopeptide (TPR) repeat protein
MRKSLANPNQSTEANSESSVAWYSQGDALANMGNYDEALACFDKAVGIQPSHHAAWVFRGVMLIHLERYQEALESCNEALKFQPRDAEAWTFRGVALHRLGHYKAAYASYDKALGMRRQPFRETIVQNLKGLRQLLQ